MQSPTDEATKILLPVNILKTAKMMKSPNKQALVIHTYNRLCLKLMKQMKEDASIIVIESIALKI